VREVSGPLPEDLKFLGEPQMRFDTTRTPAANEPFIQRMPARDGSLGEPPGLQIGDRSAGLQNDPKVAIVVLGSLVAAAAVLFAGTRK
jgi:hypothetical protein